MKSWVHSRELFVAHSFWSVSLCIKRYHRDDGKVRCQENGFYFTLKEKNCHQSVIFSVHQQGFVIIEISGAPGSVCLTYFYFMCWFSTFPTMAFEKSQRITSFMQLSVYIKEKRKTAMATQFPIFRFVYNNKVLQSQQRKEGVDYYSKQIQQLRCIVVNCLLCDGFLSV